MKRVISILLVALMLFGMLPSTAVHSHAAESNEVTMSIYANKGTLSGKSISWNSGVITFTNNQASSSTAIRTSDSDHYRIYQKSSVEIACSGGNITKVVVTCTSSTYATAFKNSVGNIATVSGSTVTITPTTPTDVISIASFTAQSRINQIVVTYVTETAACEHTNTTTTTVDATCTEDGSVTVTCDDCGETVSTETIDALGHNYQLVGGSYVCQNNCGIDVASYTVSFSVPAGVSAVESLTTDLNGQVTLPSAGVPNGEHTYTFAGWTTGIVEDSTTAPTIYEADDSFTPQDDITLKAVYTYTVAGAGGSSEYVLTDIGNIRATDEVVITMTYETTVYALNSANGTSKAPAATTVSVANNKLTAVPASNLIWNIGGSAGAYIFYPNGTTDTWLYCTDTNNGVRVGTNSANTFSIDSDSGYLMHKGTDRFLGVYRTTPDWRCYTNTTGNTADQTLRFFVKTSGSAVYYTTEITASECEHIWDSGVQTSAPSCEVAGVMTYTCALCGETKTEAIDALGHTEGTPVTENEVNASCVENGSYDTVVYCSVCNKELSRVTTTVEATGHNFSGGSCTVCGASDPNVGGKAYQLVTDAAEITAGGQFVIVATDSNGNHFALPTSIASKMSGVTVNIEDNKVVFVEGTTPVWTVESSGDGFALTNGTNYLKYSSSTNLGSNGSTPYTWTLSEVSEGVYKVVANSDTNRGLVFRAASYNQYGGYSLSNVTTSSTEYFGVKFYKMVVLCNHNDTENHDEVAATCTTVGYTAGVYCNDCESYISGHEVIDMIDHSWNDGVETTAPGCETTGVKTYTCSVCGETKTEEIAATGHTMNEGVVIDPTCENAGSKTYTCTVCGKEQVETIAALGHNWGEGKVVTAATCDAAGEMSYTCGNDPSHTKTEEIPALGHKWGAGVETTAATCDTAGIMTYTCETDPSHTKTEAIPALGHNYGDDNICDNCGKEIGYFQHITDYTKILAGGEYVIAAKSGDTFYALGTDVDSEPTAYEVAVVGTGANMIIQYADTVPIWNIEYFMHKTNCVALSANGSYLKGTDSTSFGNNDSTPWAWTFADVENDAQATPDEEYAVQKEDGSVAYVLVSESISDRAISYANDVFKNYSIRNDYNRELYFFKMVEADATEYTATFVENGITTMTQTVSADENVVKMPQPTSDTLPEGYTKFVGWVTLPHSESLIAPSVIYSAEEGDGHNNTMALTENTTFYALYSREDFNAEGQAMSYHLVTNQNQLVVGQNYIIVGLHTDGNYYAMSVKQLSDDRGASPVTPDAEGAITFVPQDQIAVFQLQHGYEIGSFAFLDLAMNKFLYCASSSENSLNSQDTLDEAASFTITVHDETDGHYSVMLDGLYGNRLMFNNSHTSSSDRFFSCYGPNSSIKEENTFLYVGVPNTTSATYYTTGLCAHDWVQTAEVEANCEHAGYTQFTCFICGEIKLEDVQAHGHNVGDQIITTNPTCTTTGLATSTCTNCGKTFEEVIPATGHTEVTDAAVAPTCTETGLTEGVHCAVCDAVLIPQVTVSANGHNYGEWTVDVKPTFTDPGTQHQLCPNCNEVHTEEIAQLPFPVYSYGVTLGNSIGETFLIDPAYTQDATVTFTVAGKTYTYAVQSMDTVYDEDKDIYYPTASIPLASGQMTDAIHVVIVSPENGTATKDYTVYEYAQYILNGEYSEKTKTLVREMLNYGNYAQIYFEYNMDDLANKDLDPVTPAEMPALDANNNKAEQTDNAENVDFFGCSLVHWFQTSINFYFKFSGNIESYEFSANGEILTPEVKGNMCFVTVAGFNPQNLSEDVTIIVNDGTGELSVTYSPMDYITRMYYNGSAPVELKNLVQAMYGYHLAAVAYKTNSES